VEATLRDGRIDVGAIILEPALDEASLLAAVGDNAKPLVHNGVYRSYLLTKATVNGRDFRPSAYFTDGQLASVHLTYADPQAEGGSAWENYSFERERAIARDDAQWLTDTLAGIGSLTDTYTFKWGRIWSGFDEHCGFSSIVVSYNQAQD
jgi:hypothetical protein